MITRIGYSFVELSVAVALIATLVSLTVSTMDQSRDKAKELATQRDLATIRDGIIRWQIDHGQDWTPNTFPPTTAGPGSDGGTPSLDPWGAPYRIDSVAHRVWSIGPDGRDGGGTEGDDLVLTWDGVSGAPLTPPAHLRLVEASVRGVDHATVRIAWEPGTSPSGVQGYEVFRWESNGGSRISTVPLNPERLPAADALEYADESAVPGHSYYYAVELVASDGRRCRTRGGLGAFVAAPHPGPSPAP